MENLILVIGLVLLLMGYLVHTHLQYHNQFNQPHTHKRICRKCGSIHLRNDDGEWEETIEGNNPDADDGSICTCQKYL